MTDLPHAAPDVVWSVEVSGIIVVSPGRNAALHLSYPKAAVWELIHRNYPYDDILLMLAAITGMARNGAKKVMVAALHDWMQCGLLVKKEESGEPFHHLSVQ